ncbi:MAG: hypothetical protein ACO1TE_14240 [Prosthecobacter sp.]
MKPGSKYYMTPLSNDQKAQLCILARQAFTLSRERGAVDDDVKYDDWRAECQLEACGVASLRECNQSHYLAIRGKWFVILGNLEQAFYDFLNAGAANEACKQMKWRLMGHVAALADGIRTAKARIQIVLDAPQAATEAWIYTGHLAKDKFHGLRVDNLDAEQLEQLGFTVLNRANDKLGKGSPENRNKKQRKTQAAKKALKATESGSLEPFERPSNGTTPTITLRASERLQEPV